MTSLCGMSHGDTVHLSNFFHKDHASGFFGITITTSTHSQVYIGQPLWAVYDHLDIETEHDESVCRCCAIANKKKKT